jgi:hypothetical protein
VSTVGAGRDGETAAAVEPSDRTLDSNAWVAARILMRGRDLLDRQFGRLLAPENSARVTSGDAELVRNVAYIAHDTAVCGELPQLVDRGHGMTER